MANNINKTDTLSQDSIKAIYDNSLFYTHTEVEEQIPCIQIKEPDFDSTVASFGNISTVVGKPKAGKTFVVTAIAAALLKNITYLKFVGQLPQGKNKVLFIDTEQSKRDCKKVSQRLSTMTGTPGKHPENLIYVRLRGNIPSTIVQVVEYAVNNVPGIGAIIIDGIKDLVFSINDEREATTIAAKLLNWSETKGIHILTVIHQNKMDLNTRGHIGTELENKSETVLTVEKDRNDKGLIIVKGKLMRDQEFTPFAFRINEGLPELAEYNDSMQFKKNKNPEAYDDQWHFNLLEFIFPKNNNCSGNEFNESLKEQLEKLDMSISEKPRRQFLKYYLDKGFIKNFGSESKLKLVLNE